MGTKLLHVIFYMARQFEAHRIELRYDTFHIWCKEADITFDGRLNCGETSHSALFW